jgi:hypothetical protein
MNAIKVDDARRVQLPELNPGDYYEPIYGEKEVVLRKVDPPGRKMSRDEILRAIDSSPLRFTKSWVELKEEIR